MTFSKRTVALAAVCAVGVAAPAALSAQSSESNAPQVETAPAPAVPEWTPGLRTLEVEDALLDQGVAYYLTKSDVVQFKIEMQSALTRLVATTSQAGGFLIGPWAADELAEADSPVIAGAVRLPTASLLTDTRLDGTLQSGIVADSNNYPDISFLFDAAEVRGRRAGEASDSNVFDLLIKGTALFKKTAIPLEIDAELTLLLSSNETMQSALGDLAVLKGKFDLTAEQLGVLPQVAAMFGGAAEVDFFLLFSTVDPRRAIIPPATPAAYSLQSRYLTSLNARNDPATAYQAGEDLIAAAWDDAASLSSFAQQAVFSAGSNRRFFGQAQRAAERAVELGGDTPDALALDVLAKIAAETGDLQTAISLQKRALEFAGSGPAARSRTRIESALALYETLLAEPQPSP